MAVEIGTASNHTDLLLKLETFLTTNPQLVAANQQWESKKDNRATPYSMNADPDANGFSLSRFFVGHGLDGQDNIVVPMVLRNNIKESYYTLSAYAARTYAVDKNVNEQLGDNVLGKNNNVVCISLWHSEMKYWFIANGRRFIVIAKVANRYVSMYCGFIKPSGTDLEYPYPLLVGGNHNFNNRAYSNSDTNSNRSFFNPQASSSSSSMIFTPSGRLCMLDNVGGNSVYTSSINMIGATFPYNIEQYVGKTLDGQYLLLDIDIVHYYNGLQHLGWFDGVCYVSGFENSPENIITVGSDRYICIPAMVQNGFNNWAAIKLE